jgi:hypothetical protein
MGDPDLAGLVKATVLIEVHPEFRRVVEEGGQTLAVCCQAEFHKLQVNHARVLKAMFTSNRLLAKTLPTKK